MANKKIWAYAKVDSGDFIKDERGRLKLFFIWQALKLKKTDIFEFNKLTFFSTQADESKRTRMTPVVKGFFRYIENTGGGGVTGDGESLSHSIAILALSELDSINFVFGKNEYVFNFSEIRTEDLKIRFESGRFYFPDLVGFFSNDNPYFEKWGGKVALEVKVSHGCEPEKVQDFFAHNIPIVEINITEKLRFKEELNKQSFDENDLERYYKFLKKIFGNKVYGRILVDPSSETYNKKLISSEKNKNCRLKEQLNNESDKSILLRQELARSRDEVQLHKENMNRQHTQLSDCSKKLNEFNNRSLFTRILDVFK